MRISSEPSQDLYRKSDGRVIQADPRSAHSINVLMSRIERREAVAQTTDQRVQRLIRDARGLFISPDRRDEVRAADDLS